MERETEFGKRLAQERERAKLTQAQLGEGLGTDGADAGKSVVYGWEKRGHFPRADQLGLICRRLNCSADWLVFGIKPEWPFSLDLRIALTRLKPRDLVKMDNLMRAPLEMQPLPLPTDEPTPSPEPQATTGDVRDQARKTRDIKPKGEHRKTG